MWQAEQIVHTKIKLFIHLSIHSFIYSCRAISIHLGPKYIKLPFTEPEAEDLVVGFHRDHDMPQCFGAIDGTHIEIKQPSTNSMDYINRKGKYPP